MSGIPVNNNLNVLANIVNQATVVAKSRDAVAGNQEEQAKDSFDIVMNRVNSQAAAQKNSQGNTQADTGTNVQSSTDMGAKTMSPQVAAADSSKQSDAGNSKAKASQGAAKTDSDAANQTDKAVSDKDTSDKPVSDKVSSDEEVSAKDISAEDKAAAEKAGEELVEEVAEEMGITIEEVEEIMEILGLSAMQLLNPENMQQLLIAISGNEDNLAILTDGELYAHLQNMLDMVGTALEELQTQLGLSEEELSAVIADMAVVQNESEAGNVLEEVPVQDGEEPEVNLEGMKDYAVTVHKDGETVEVKVRVDDASGEETAKEVVKAAPQAQAKPENKPDGQNLSDGSKNEGRGGADTAGSFVMQTPVEQPTLSEIPQQPIMERYVSTEDIMNQIMESMKINLKGDVQELELHLHPESLGNVHVQISAKEGMVTAQFIAQNETVKAAIESQLVQLRTQFEEQGIKVDEVEVAVGDYRFEHSFAGSEENARENAENGNGKKTRRSINLSELDLDELPEDMDDSERIAAEMMAQSGNMVDYTA